MKFKLSGVPIFFTYFTTKNLKDQTQYTYLVFQIECFISFMNQLYAQVNTELSHKNLLV